MSFINLRYKDKRIEPTFISSSFISLPFAIFSWIFVVDFLRVIASIVIFLFFIFSSSSSDVLFFVCATRSLYKSFFVNSSYVPLHMTLPLSMYIILSIKCKFCISCLINILVFPFRYFSKTLLKISIEIIESTLDIGSSNK